MTEPGPIGIFDSGYGGLTVFKDVLKLLPQYDYVYLGDNARAPYGIRSFQTVYQYTLECVKHLFEMNCSLVILACNTASAKALRTIQQEDLPGLTSDRRVLGVIRPTAEIIGNLTQTGNIGIFATQGTVDSQSYIIEIKKFFPKVNIFQESCPMWVPLVENNEYESYGADYFIKKHIDNLLKQCSQIDTILLACTHYPLLITKIRQFLPNHIKLVSQGEIVAQSLKTYLTKHLEIEQRCTKNGDVFFYTTESTVNFNQRATAFINKEVSAKKLHL